MLNEKFHLSCIGGGMHRRGFLRGGLALGALVTAGGLILPRPARAEPKRGGSVKMAHAHGSTTDTLDPGTGTNDFLYSLVFACNNCLTEIAADGTVVGELAEGWEASPDATIWTFRLRKGVVFHDGRPVTAKDVVASINHHRGKDSTSAAKPLVEAVTDIKADGDGVVVITLASGNADLPLILSTYQFPIKPEKDGKMDWQSGIGSGAYVLKSFEPGVSASLERFDGYWKKDRGWFDKIEMLTVADNSARSNALMTGQVQIISRPELKFIDRLGAAPGIAVDETQGSSSYGFPAMVNVAPFDNVDVLKALKLAINREELVKKILFGHGSVANDTPIGPGYRYRATVEELPQRSYDPDKAKFHLKQAGHESLKVTMNIADAAFPGAIDAALLYQQSAKAAGIDLDVIRDPEDGYWSNTWNVKPFTGVYWNGYPSEDMIFSVSLGAGGAWNATKFNNKRFEDLLLKARSELKEELRREMYVEMQKIVHDEDGAVTPVFNNFVWARSDKVATGGALSNNMDLDGQRWCERWWLA